MRTGTSIKIDLNNSQGQFTPEGAWRPLPHGNPKDHASGEPWGNPTG